MRCLLCGEHVPAAETLDHMRLLHPDMDAQPETWADGRIVVHEDFATLEDAL